MKVAGEYSKEMDTIHFAFFTQNKKEDLLMLDFIETLIKTGATTEYGYDFASARFDIKFNNASKLMYPDEVFDNFRENIKQQLGYK